MRTPDSCHRPVRYERRQNDRAIELRALFRLLLDLARLDHESSVTLEPHILPEVAEHFQACWSRFVSEDGT